MTRIEEKETMLGLNGWEHIRGFWKHSDYIAAEGKPLLFTTDEAWDVQTRPDVADYVCKTAQEKYVDRVLKVYALKIDMRKR